MKKSPSPILVVGACLIVQVCVGIIYIWSVFKAPAMAFYGWAEGSTNLVASFMLFSFCAGNFAGGAAADSKGPKKVCFVGILLFGSGLLLSRFIPVGSSIILFYLTYSVLGGFGSGVSYGAMLTCIQRWLPHRRGFATGIGAGAFGLSTVVFSPVADALIKGIGFDSALAALAVVFLVLGLLSCSIIRLPGEDYLASLPKATGKAAALRRESIPFSKAVRTLPFWLLFLNIFLFNGTWNMLNPLIKGLGIQRGLGEAAAVMAVSLTGLANTAGRVLISTYSDRLGRINTLYLVSAATAVCALLLSFVSGWGYLVVVLLTAFAFGGPAAVNPAATTDFFGPKHMGANYGVIMMALGISSIVFNSISNALYAATGEYKLTFLLGAATAVANIVNCFVISRKLKSISNA